MTDSRWKNLALEVIGCFVSALGLYSFAVAAGVPVTGVAGIGAILFRLFGLPIGVTNIIMNIPIVLICFKYLGKDFFFRSVRWAETKKLVFFLRAMKNLLVLRWSTFSPGKAYHREEVNIYGS